MFPGLDVAVVLTSRNGKPLLLQSRGVEPRLALMLARQANSTIREHARLQLEGDLDFEGTGDLPLDVKAGKVYVLNRRYTVLYRLVQQVYVTAVVKSGTNLYAANELLVNVAKILVRLLAQKGHQVDPERLARKYGEVYTALEEMVQGPLFGDHAADDVSAKGGKAGAGGEAGAEDGGKGGGKAGKRSKLMPSFSKKSRKVEEGPLKTIEFKSLADEASCFDTSPPGYQPYQQQQQQQQYVQPQAFAVQSSTPPGPPSDQQRDVSVGASASSAAAGPVDPFAGMVFEDLSLPAGVSVGAAPGTDAFGNAAPAGGPADALAAVASHMAAQQQQGQQGLAQGALQFGDAARLAMQAAAQAGPPGMKEPGLYLVEVWKGQLVGDKMAKAGVEGVVLEKSAAPDGPPPKQAQLFKLVPGEATRPLGHLLLCAVGVDRFQVDKYNSAQGLFRAQLGQRSQRGGSTQFAMYRLPPLAVPAPLGARLFTVPCPPGRTKQSHVLVVELRAHPGLGDPLTDLVIDVDVPPRLGLPGRVTPRAEWSSLQRTLRFTRPALAPGERCALRASFTADLATVSRPGSASQLGARALVHFSSGGKGSLSGIQLETGESAESLQPTYSVFHGELEVKPRPLMS